MTVEPNVYSIKKINKNKKKTLEDFVLTAINKLVCENSTPKMHNKKKSQYLL